MIVYVVGFVSDGDVGGFEWRHTYESAKVFQQSLMRDGTYDISDVETYEPSHVYPDAITRELDMLPGLWEPAYGQNRTKGG